MSTTSRRFDAVVVGAGTAGANVAYQLARRDLQVALVERRAADRGGAHWHNGVLDWQFVAAGLDPPAAPERVTSGGVTHLFGPDGTRAVTVHDSPITRADMRLLGDRLRRLARDAGVELIDHASITAFEVVDGRPVAIHVETSPGEPASGRREPVRVRLEAPLFVDASGRRGVLRRQVPTLAPWCPEVRVDELCTASDHHLRVVDPDGAKAFLERHEANPGEGVTIVGVAGGFSTRAVTVNDDLTEASVLVGCLGNGRYRTGPTMLDDLRHDERWLGESLGGGAGVIPLRRPYARLGAAGVALVGDAACQVFPGHGSGIGMGLMAGTMLAAAVAGADDPGAEDLVWAYQARFWHEHGGLLAAFDAFRRMSTSLGADGVTRMIRAGLLTEAMTRGGLDQKWQTPPPSGIPAMVAKLASVPGVAAKMLPMLARGQALRAMGPHHPAELDMRALQRWDRRVTRLLGPLPS